MTDRSVGIRIELAILELVLMAGAFLMGMGIAMMIGVKSGRMDRTTADCVAYLALGVAVYFAGKNIAEKKENELKGITEVKE